MAGGQLRKHQDDGRSPADLANLTEEDGKHVKKKQLLSLKRKECEDRRAVKDEDQGHNENEQEEAELRAQGGKRLQVPESSVSAAFLDPGRCLLSVSGGDKKKKWRVTDPAQIAPNFYHRDLFSANFPLVEVVDVPERTRFPVQDKFEGRTLDDRETAQARTKWFQAFLKAEHAYAKAETESQAFPTHFAFLDAVWQFTKPSFEEVNVHRKRCWGLKRKLPFDDMLAQSKRLKPGTEENSGFCINLETEDIEEAELYGDLEEDVDAATGFADGVLHGVLHVHDDRPQKKAANMGSGMIFNPDRVVGILERKFAEDKHKWNARFQGGFYAVKHTMVNLWRGHGRPVYVLVKTSSSWSYGILVPEGFVQIRDGVIDINSMGAFERHQHFTGNKQMGLEELQVKLQKGTAFYRKNFRDNPQANYADGPMLVGTFYLSSDWFALPKAEYGNGQVEGPRRLFEGLMRLILGDCAMDLKDEDFKQRWQLREQMLKEETQAWFGSEEAVCSW